MIDTSSRSPTETRTKALVALECRTTLVRASVATRYVATSTAAGNRGISAGTSTSTSTDSPSARQPSWSARCWSAPTRPSSSSARGRSSSTSRRTSARATRVSRRSVVSRSFACLGSVSIRFAAASAPKAIPVNVGPSPSCSSRRRRCRSSSWVATKCVSGRPAVRWSATLHAEPQPPGRPACRAPGHRRHSSGVPPGVDRIEDRRRVGRHRSAARSTAWAAVHRQRRASCLRARQRRMAAVAPRVSQQRHQISRHQASRAAHRLETRLVPDCCGRPTRRAPPAFAAAATRGLRAAPTRQSLPRTGRPAPR